MRRARKGKRRSAGKPPPRPETLQYKVVELSTVDEGHLEHTVNLWVRQGWKLENVQLAMRESSKRPAMAFVFFTRAGEPAADETAPAAEGRAEARAAASEERRAVPVTRAAPKVLATPGKAEASPPRAPCTISLAA